MLLIWACPWKRCALFGRVHFSKTLRKCRNRFQMVVIQRRQDFSLGPSGPSTWPGSGRRNIATSRTFWALTLSLRLSNSCSEIRRTQAHRIWRLMSSQNGVEPSSGSTMFVIHRSNTVSSYYSGSYMKKMPRCPCPVLSLLNNWELWHRFSSASFDALLAPPSYERSHELISVLGIISVTLS
ncbi:uncharacterized protein LOC120426979 isoform X1 [Culex pipiens pallens]|uniref:uncharacterized protein LOC120426979 isoform X1 n=1 Tax=Culex pipiens pallens TaxID=42434 RepID=UPI0022AB499F|nr:uncharacterized protein LOC120426979 isoform X1 [Culex pipiens pallens]